MFNLKTAIMTQKILRIATRQSALALWQANHVRSTLLNYWPDLQIELLPLISTGDKFLETPLYTLGGKGLFVKELEEALLDKRADIAVHSMKDVPSLLPEGLILPTICTRGNPFDAYISIKYPQFDTLPKGAIIGTTSLRRQSQLLAKRPDLQMKSLRGNVQTRYAKLVSLEYDAIILAVAGLQRLDMGHVMSEILSDELMLPSCGQGAIGIECRESDSWVQQLLAPLNHPATSLCVHTERLVNKALGGSCHTPLAVYCVLDNPQHLILRAKLASPEGGTILYQRKEGPPEKAEETAHQCVEALYKAGASQLISHFS